MGVQFLVKRNKAKALSKYVQNKGLIYDFLPAQFCKTLGDDCPFDIQLIGFQNPKLKEKKSTQNGLLEADSINAVSMEPIERKDFNMKFHTSTCFNESYEI